LTTYIKALILRNTQSCAPVLSNLLKLLRKLS